MIPGYHLCSFTCVISYMIFVWSLTIWDSHGYVLLLSRESKYWVPRVFFTRCEPNYSEKVTWWTMRASNLMNKRLLYGDWPKWLELFELKNCEKNLTKILRSWLIYLLETDVGILECRFMTWSLGKLSGFHIGLISRSTNSWKLTLAFWKVR